MKKIFVLGAFDRFNYGDLIFAHVLKTHIKKHIDNCDIIFVGLRKSDLTMYGGLKTRSISTLRKIKNNDSHLIIAGGEVLSSSWDSWLSSLNRLYFYFSKTKKVIKMINFNRIAKFLSYGKTEYPFLISKKDFCLTSVLYNSVGGSHIDSDFLDRNEINLKKLMHSDYMSVRDSSTNKILSSIGINSVVRPDSAIVISEMYPLNVLENLVDCEIKELVANSIGYVFFQINKNLYSKNKEEIISQLSSIAQKHDVNFCFCPIGTAPHHEDHLALKNLNKKIINSFYVDKISIWNIMYLIAKSSMYIGTSLHGAITAMSYKIPYIGIEVTKLDSYLNTWGIQKSNKTIKFNEISDKYNDLLSVDHKELEISLHKQYKETLKSLNTINQHLKSNLIL